MGAWRRRAAEGAKVGGITGVTPYAGDTLSSRSVTRLSRMLAALRRETNDGAYNMARLASAPAHRLSLRIAPQVKIFRLRIPSKNIYGGTEACIHST